MAVGFFGKLLSHGDFVSRRLPVEWIDVWDRWLQRGIARSRQQLGVHWTEYYLVSPICRFILGCGSVDQHAWIGILMASVDRVGRHYPLTLASPIDLTASLGSSHIVNADWYLNLENLALSTLSADFDFAEFDYQLQMFPSPIVATHTQIAGQNIPASLNTLSMQSLPDYVFPATQPHCLWFINRSEHTGGYVRYSQGLLPVDTFRFLIGADVAPENE